MKQKIIFVVIIILAFLYRLIGLDYPLINTEPQRDYLIAQHILTYQDFPEKGPCCIFNGAYAPYRHPVIYYYFLAGLLAINQNFMFLASINLLLQFIPLITIFILTSRFFSYSAGLLAIFFYSFHQAIYKSALFLWQPHLKLPFLYGSFLALFLFYKTKKIWFLVISILTFFISSAIHLSSMATAPFWLISLFFILRSQKRSVRFYFITLFLICISLAALKGVSLEVFKNPLLLTHTSIFGYIQSLSANVQVFLSSLYGNGKEISIIGIFLLILNCVFIIGYLFKKEPGPKKLYAIILIAIIVVFLAGVSFLKATIWHFYLPPLFGIAIIVFAQTISTQKHFLLRILALLWIILFIWQFFIYYPPQINFFSNARHIDLATTKLTQRIKKIQDEKNYSQPNFFSIRVYTQGVETPTIEDLAFWLPLEEKLGRKFIQVDDKDGSFKRLNSSRFIYVICLSFAGKIDISKECIEPFNKEFPKYRVGQGIYKKEPITIFETTLQ